MEEDIGFNFMGRYIHPEYVYCLVMTDFYVETKHDISI